MPIYIFFLYKIVLMIVGGAIVYLGFLLFNKGILAKDGEFEGELDSMKLKLTNAAPGTFFALFGATVIMVCLLKGWSVDDKGDQIQIIGLNNDSTNSKTHVEGVVLSELVNNRLMYGRFLNDALVDSLGVNFTWIIDGDTANVRVVKNPPDTKDIIAGDDWWLPLNGPL